MDEGKHKKRELSEQQKKLIFYLFGEAEGDWLKAKRLAGYAETTSVREVMEPLREEVQDSLTSYLASLGPKAMIKYGNLLDDSNVPGASNRIKVIEGILNRLGVSEKKPGDDVQIKVPSGGIFILPAKEVQTFERVSDAAEDREE